MEDVQIQAQDSNGNWRTYMVTVNEPQMIFLRMEELKKQFPHFRIRAITMDGRLVDLL